MPLEPIVIAGVGAVGGYVGGALAAAGKAVRLLARPSVVEEVRSHGMRLTDLDGREERLTAIDFDLITDNALAALAGAACVIVTVKSPATAGMAQLIADHAPPHAVVASLQNGLRNVARLRERLPERDVRAGVFAPNVARLAPGEWRRGTDGGVHLEAGDPAAPRPDLAPLFAGSLLEARSHVEIRQVQWGKILMNLNNALNALSGRPLRAELADPHWRRLLARQIDEAGRLIKAAGETAAPVGRTRPQSLRFLLSLPTPLFLFALDRVTRVDATATSSMQDDLRAGRMTEVDDLQGEIVALAEALGRESPVSRLVLEAVRDAESARAGSPNLDPAELTARLKAGGRARLAS